MEQKSINIAVIGGSGFWSNENHHKNILKASDTHNAKLKVIVDLTNPSTVTHHDNLQTIMIKHRPRWLNPTDFRSPQAIIASLKNEFNIDLVIIASNPTTHFAYGLACIKNNLNALIDKPVVSEDNAASDIKAATKIKDNYNTLLNAYTEALKSNPSLLFHTILRRRSLIPFVKVADELASAFNKTGAGINSATFVINGGKYKLPAELTGGGAHGYQTGVGSLSHSAYHYIDVMAWFLACAPGDITYLKTKLNYVTRIKDYLETKAYDPLLTKIESNSDAFEVPHLSDNLLQSELNSGFTFELYNSQHANVGAISFTFNLLTFSPRTRGYDHEIDEPADLPGGGRTSHIIIDIHQDGLQNWQIIKDDIVFEGNTISLRGRRHPLLGGMLLEEKVYQDAYEPEISMSDLFQEVLSKIASSEPLEEHPVIRSLAEERVATEVYASCYELLSKDSMDLSNSDTPMIRI